MGIAARTPKLVDVLFNMARTEAILNALEADGKAIWAAIARDKYKAMDNPITRLLPS
jgi:hypothetical protein